MFLRRLVCEVNLGRSESTPKLRWVRDQEPYLAPNPTCKYSGVNILRPASGKGARSMGPVEFFVRMLLVFFRLAPGLLGTVDKPSEVSGELRHDVTRRWVSTHVATAWGSMSARCCMLMNRSLNKLPSGCKQNHISVQL